MTNFCLKPGTALRSPKHTYTIIKVLGQGGFGITYLVEAQFRLGNIDFRHEFTVKELFMSKYCYRQENSNNVCCYPNFTNDVKAYKDAFIAESQRLQRLGIKHPNIVNIDEVFEANGTAYYVMEYIKGRSLADYVESTPGGRLTFDQTAALMQPICEAVAMLHSHHLVHYDIKPQNIMIEQDSQGSLRPVLIDFGLAKHYNSQGAPTTSPVAGGYSLGYAPVEQYNGIRSFQPTADVYALAATTYFCLIGDRPANADELDLNSVRNELQRLRIAADAVKAICQALEYRPQSRPANAAALTALLFGHLEPEIEVVEADEGTELESQFSNSLPSNHRSAPSVQPTGPSLGSRPKAAPAAQPAPSAQPAPPALTPEQMYQKAKALYDQKQFAEAVEWYRKAAEQGHAEAQLSLGSCYAEGKGVSAQDYTEAVKWYRKAADQGGNTMAQFLLANSYYNGRGVLQDYDEAVKWYRKAAEQGDSLAWDILCSCYKEGKGLPKGAEQGNAKAQLEVGKVFYRSDIHKGDAVAWFRKAAEQGLAEAQYYLGECYSSDDIFFEEPDYAEAVYWYSKAAKQGYAKAKEALKLFYTSSFTAEQMYKEGIRRYGEKQYDKAIKWFLRAAEMGHVIAQSTLGSCYYNGEGVAQDYAEAVKWYRKAAAQGNASGQFNLGHCYEYGKGVAQSASKALEWYRKAADQGNADAQDALKRLEVERPISTPPQPKSTPIHSLFKGLLAKLWSWLPDLPNWLIIPGIIVIIASVISILMSWPAWLLLSIDCICCIPVVISILKEMWSDMPVWFTISLSSVSLIAIGFFIYFNIQLSVAKDLLVEGNGYYNNEQYEAAVDCYRKAAEQGNGEAQNSLGNCYYSGKGVSQDYAEAVKWYRKAAEQGYVWGQYNLANCYYNGKGVSQDYAEALKWYRKSAEQGNAEALNRLGICYADGKAVSQDYAEAVAWYRKAAEQGYAWGQYNLANCYYNGEGVSQDYAEAVKWYRKSAEQGNSSAQNSLGNCYYNGKGVPQDYAEAVAWYRKSAEQGNSSAQNSLGNCYYRGRGMPQDYDEAVKWYRKAAEQGYDWGQTNLGNRYYNGEGVSQSYVEAVYWYRKAAEQGNSTAQNKLGQCYEYGRGVMQSKSDALTWYRKAAENNNTSAQESVRRLEDEVYR